MVSINPAMRRYAMYMVAVLWVIKCFAENTAIGGGGGGKGKKGGGKGKGGSAGKAIDAEAKKHSIKLIKICFESFTSKESALLYALVSVLLLRTLLSIVIADVDGHLVKMLINRDKKQLLVGVAMWLGIAVPSSFINALIKYLQSRLSLALRAKLTAYTRNRYFELQTYYRVAQQNAAASTSSGGGAAIGSEPNSTTLVSNNNNSSSSQQQHEAFAASNASLILSKDVAAALQHPESVLTEDVACWADRFAELLSSIGKPLVDLAFLSGILYSRLGFVNQFTASVLVWESGKLLKYVRPDFGGIVQERGSLEAELRGKHTRIIAASEEIAFCHGEARERERLSTIFGRLMKFQEGVLNRQIVYHTIEDFVTKYLWSVIGMIQVAVPLLKSGTTAGDNAKYFITVRRIMIRNGDAVERCLTGIKDAIEFNGYTMKIANLLTGFEQVVDHVKKQQQTRELSQQQQQQQQLVSGDVAAASKDNNDENNSTGGESPTTCTTPTADMIQASRAVTAVTNVHHTQDSSYAIVVRGVSLRTPQGDALTSKLNLALKPGDRMLVLGPNGCGKSSLFRVLCGLWPHNDGFIKKPNGQRDLFFVPQKPYLVVGTFRDQIIYPDTLQDMTNKGITDDDILAIVENVLMVGPMEAHGGLNALREWSEVLSGGEKQRLGIARVFYHKPQFAVLDECSSAINVEAEQVIFQRMLDASMGLITISHRQTLFPFHNKLLTFDGEGGVQFEDDFRCDTFSERSEKKVQLMARLQRVLQDLGEAWPATVQDALGNHHRAD